MCYPSVLILLLLLLLHYFSIFKMYVRAALSHSVFLTSITSCFTPNKIDLSTPCVV